MNGSVGSKSGLRGIRRRNLLIIFLMVVVLVVSLCAYLLQKGHISLCGRVC